MTEDTASNIMGNETNVTAAAAEVIWCSKCGYASNSEKNFYVHLYVSMRQHMEFSLNGSYYCQLLVPAIHSFNWKSYYCIGSLRFF